MKMKKSDCFITVGKKMWQLFDWLKFERFLEQVQKEKIFFQMLKNTKNQLLPFPPMK
jgi:DNA-directed RNA polymerase delta subunit